MKKIYMLSLAAITTAALAQAPKIGEPKFPTGTKNDVPAQVFKTTKDVSVPSVVKQNSGSGKASIGTKATLIGVTQNDLQSNGATYSRITYLPGGKLSVTWTTAQEGGSSVSRGAGYNHFDGTNWMNIAQASLRIEPKRTGFPNMIYNPTTNQEIILSHLIQGATDPIPGNSGGIMFNIKSGVGAGTWTSNAVLTETDPLMPTQIWCRGAVSGDYMVVIANFTDSNASQIKHKRINGVRNPLVYSRYQFSTSTWLVQSACLPGYDSTRYADGSADNYAIDASGNNVAIIQGGSTDDIAMWKSTDNGATWTKKMIRAFPIPAFNPSERPRMLDTTTTCDGGVNIIVDGTGKAHCFWGRLRVYDDGDSTNTQYYISLGMNSLDYWYEGNPDSIKSISGIPDIDNDGSLNVGTIDARTRYGNSTLATRPSSCIGPDGTMYVIFSGLTENDLDGSNGCFRDVYITYSTNNGATWSDPQNLTQWRGFNNEEMFASITRSTDANNLHISFMTSGIVGPYSTNNTGKVGPFDIVYLKVPIADVKAGTAGVKEIKNNAMFSIEQNFPNPFNGNTTIPVVFKNTTNASVSIVNMLGETVYSNKFNRVPSGRSNIEINTGNMSAGVYFYSVEADGIKVTKKMIVD